MKSKRNPLRRRSYLLADNKPHFHHGMHATITVK